MQAPPISDHETQQLLTWLQTMTFSRAPRNLTRDFSDGVLMAEVLRHQLPGMVQLHNYQPASSSAAKYMNWKTLNEKVFRKLGFQVARADVEAIIGNTPGAVERVLHYVYSRLLSGRTQMPRAEGKMSEQGSSRKAEEEGRSAQHAREVAAQLADKEGIIRELRETVEILEAKMKKMQQLNKLKDAKIDSLMRKIDQSIGL